VVIECRKKENSIEKRYDMKIRKVCRCKNCKKIYPNGIAEICNCGSVLGEKIPKIERLEKMFFPGATITFSIDALQGYEEGVLRKTDNCEDVIARKRFLRKWEVVEAEKNGRK